jgi:hypothetical protein
VALIEAYFDESYGRGGVLCVGGYAFTGRERREFERAWANMLRRWELPYFRMSACAHHQRPFDCLTKQACVEVEKQAIDIIKRYASCGFAVTVDPADFDRIAKGQGLKGEPYEFLAWLAILVVRNWLEDSGQVGSIAYFFEAGHARQRSANALMNRMFADARLREVTMYRAHGFVAKEDCRAAQAADLLAWQWFTDKKRRLHPRFKEPRKDLMALIEARHKVMHADVRFLQEMMDGMRKMFGPDNANEAAVAFRERFS